jgi:hypothetical protein
MPRRSSIYSACNREQAYQLMAVQLFVDAAGCIEAALMNAYTSKLQDKANKN